MRCLCKASCTERLVVIEGSQPNRVRERLRISIVEQARRIAEEVGQLPAGTVRSLPTVATVNNYCEKIYKLLGSRGAV